MLSLLRTMVTVFHRNSLRKLHAAAQYPVGLTQPHLPLPLQPSLAPVTTILPLVPSLRHTLTVPFLHPSFHPSHFRSLQWHWKLQFATQCIFFFTQTELHANNYCKESWVCLKLSGFWSIIANGPLLRLISTVQLLPRVRVVLWLGRVGASRHHRLRFSQTADIILNYSLIFIVMSTDKANSFPSLEKLLVKTEERRVLQICTTWKIQNSIASFIAKQFLHLNITADVGGKSHRSPPLDEEQQKTDKCWEREN